MRALGLPPIGAGAALAGEAGHFELDPDGALIRAE